LTLAPGIYDLEASAFGYHSDTAWGVRVLAHTSTTRDFALARKPTGSLRVKVIDASAGLPITATLAILGTPHTAVTHTFALDLPAAQYTIHARRLGFRVVTATALITTGETSVVDLALPGAPSILLVDSGGWYYESYAPYFRQALSDLSYAYREWSIRHLPDDIPSAADLTPYDIVVWSAPRDAPGYVGAGDAIAEYLEVGGRLLLTGQDIGFWDGGGSLAYFSPYYNEYLRTQFVDDNAPTRMLLGLDDDIFAGTVITIAGPGGADNQDFPDVVAVADPDAAAPVLNYHSNGCAGVRVGTCLGYRVVYLPFGFEGISGRAERRAVMGESLSWLGSSPREVGLEIQPRHLLGIGEPGSVVTHTVRVRHLGWSGRPERVHLSLQDASWHTQLSSPALSLSPCISATATISVTIPVAAGRDARDMVTVAARSSLSSTLVVTAELTTKTPAPVLLVDDDRWYDQRTAYEGAMRALRLPYDLWQTSSGVGGNYAAGLSLETLRRYPAVVWWTGYDWYAPITKDEQASLQGYLQSGGRLFLSSQDFLYYHHDDRFSRRFLGVLTYTEAVTPTQVVGVSEDLVGEGLGPWPLIFPQGYQNWSDGLVPGPGASVAFRDQRRRGVALGNRNDGYATLFFGFPFEALPSGERSLVMARAVGWLSVLGGSTFEASRGSISPGDSVTYTIGLRNDGAMTVTAVVSNHLPSEVAIDSQSLLGLGSYDPVGRCVSWRGEVPSGEAVTVTYRATVLSSTVPGWSILNKAQVTLEEYGLTFDRTVEIQVDAPDLSPSTFFCRPDVVGPGEAMTCTLSLINAGPAAASEATAHVYLPGPSTLTFGSLRASGGMIGCSDGQITWSGPLPAGSRTTLMFEIGVSCRLSWRTLHGVAFLNDGMGKEIERSVWLRIHPRRSYLPVLLRASPQAWAE
jgi:uncharacterized repeat protein (TIGR01451 family)